MEQIKSSNHIYFVGMASLLTVVCLFTNSVNAYPTSKPIHKKHYAKKKPNISSAETRSTTTPPIRSKTQDLLAIPLGGTVGFGLGHTLQKRYSDYGWVYTAIDAGTLLYGIGSTMGDCAPSDTTCKDRQDDNGKMALALFITSRVIQIVDLTLFASNQDYAIRPREKRTFFAVMPSPSGLQTGVGWTF